MKYVIGWNDSTEPLVLLWAPLLFLIVYGLLKKEPISLRKHWGHLLLPLLYLLSQLGYYMQPRSVKLIAYLNAYFPDIERPFIPYGLSFSYELIKSEFRWLILLSGLYYIMRTIRMIWQQTLKRKPKKNAGINKYTFTRNVLLIFFGMILIIIFTYLNYDNDLGDHYIALMQTLFIFAISFMILSESRFFEKSWIADKYDTLKFQNHDLSIDDIRKYMESEVYYLNSDTSLKDLAKRLDTNSNYLSKLINLHNGTNFNDFINAYRIDASKERLLSEEYKQLTIEGIGQSVGFRSKSAFYAAFKKYTNSSPSSFLKEHKK